MPLVGGLAVAVDDKQDDNSRVVQQRGIEQGAVERRQQPIRDITECPNDRGGKVRDTATRVGGQDGIRPAGRFGEPARESLVWLGSGRELENR